MNRITRFWKHLFCYLADSDILPLKFGTMHFQYRKTCVSAALITTLCMMILSCVPTETVLGATADDGMGNPAALAAPEPTSLEAMQGSWVRPAESESSEYLASGRPLPREIVPPRGYQLSVLRGTRTADGRPGEDYWQQFTEYDIEATLDPEERRLSATAGITWHNNSPDTLRRVHLELVQNHHAEGVPRNRTAEVTGGINLHRVTVNGNEFKQERVTRNRYTVNGTRMFLWLPEPVGNGDKVHLEIEYDFVIPQQGAGGRMGYSRDNLFYLGYWYPHMVVYDDVVGWHPDPYLGQAEFYHGFADYNLTIHAPEDWLIMATGELENAGEVLHPDVFSRWKEARQSDEPVRVFTAGGDQVPTVRATLMQEAGDRFGAVEQGDGAAQQGDSDQGGHLQGSSAFGSDPGSGSGMLTWRFSAQNVRDVAFSATRESHWDAARTPVGDLTGNGSDDYTVINTFWREEASLWSEVTAYQQHAITFLSNMTGFPYPWPHMTAIEGAGIIGGGMEYPMMTVMGDYNLRGADALYAVTAHELAHMWIPLIVSTDERRYSWLDEGNTVFSTAEAVNEFIPQRQSHRRSQFSYISAARRGDEGPIMRRSDYHYTPDHFRLASYPKPATVLVALRKLLGEEVFREAYRSFVNEWAFKQAYPWDFFRTFERVSGRDLSWFWHSWYYETWVLNQAIALVEDVEDGTRIVIHDQGEVPMPVYLTVTRMDGEKAEYKIPVDDWLRGERQTEIIIPDRQLQRVVIDADEKLPDIDRQNMMWER